MRVSKNTSTFASLLKRNTYNKHWKGGRVVDYSGLENRRAERHRGFESLPFRKKTKQGDVDLSTSFCFCSTTHTNLFVGRSDVKTKLGWFIKSLRSADFCKEPAGEARERRVALALRCQSLLRSHDIFALLHFFAPFEGFVQLVAPRQTCLRSGMSVGELLRNYKSCSYSRKSK